MIIQGSLITLRPYTLEYCHEFYREYAADPAMWEQGYSYDRKSVNLYYQSKVLDESRRFFAICLDEKIIGEIQLKYIDFNKGCATLSLHFSSDAYKNRGYGTEAIGLMTDYAFHTLGLRTVYADCVHRNTRSQHVLEKSGFVFSHEDELLRYYSLSNHITEDTI